MENKITPLEDAANLVRPGDTLALGGVTLYRRPAAFVRALLVRDPRPTGLTLLCFTAGYESDLLVGAGAVSCVRSCYFGLEVFGLAPMFTEAANQGKIAILEETEASLAFGMRAHLAKVSFMPGLAWLGTDLPRLRPDVKLIEDPYNPGQQVVAFPAIAWDVAVIHALQADPSGNARLNGNQGVDVELALGAGTVIVTAEEIVEGFAQPVDIPGVAVTAVVHTPRGAWPTSCYPLYPLAGGELLRYIEACNAGDFEGYLSGLGAEGISSSDPGQPR
jgi:glutaconate CoA-transferase, subunit A